MVVFCGSFIKTNGFFQGDMGIAGMPGLDGHPGNKVSIICGSKEPWHVTKATK